MAENSNQEIKTVGRREDEINFSDLLVVALNYWKWYVLSIIICLILAFIYVKRSQNIYQRQATVMIKSEKGSNDLESEAAAFEDLGIVTTSKSVDNEVLVFKTKRLMIEVARRLHLDVDYKIEGFFRDHTVYAQTPVKLLFPDAKEDEVFSLVMTPNADKTVTLHNFQKKGKIYSGEIIAKAGTTVKTPVGRVQVEENTTEAKKALTGKDIDVVKRNLKRVGLAYSAGLSSSRASKLASIINLSLRDTSKERAEDVLNTLVEVYNEDAINDKNKVVEGTDKFINERLETLEDELGGVDMTIANYKSSHQLTDIKTDASAFRSSYNQMEQKAAELESQKAVAQYILNYIQSSSNYDVIPNNAGLKSSQVETLISEYNTLTLQRQKLEQDAGVNNPQVLDLGNSIVQLRQRIVSSIRNLVRSLDIEIGNAHSSVGTSSSRLSAVPTQQKTVTSVERQQRIKENLYMYLLNKREANNLKKNMQESNARVLDPAEGSDHPVSPRKAMIMLIGLLLGLAIPSAFIWFSVIGSTKVRSKKDVEKVISVPFLGEIPQYDEQKTNWFKKLFGFLKKKDDKHRKQQIVVAKDSTDPVTEAIRIMRTNIQLMQAGDKDKKVLMMTSYIPNAGKTFVSSNLAASMGYAGKKVIIVDTDIRRGSLSNFIGKNLPGVTNYLGGYVDNVEDLIIHYDKCENLDVLPAGVSAPNPAELLLLPKFDEMIEELKKKYDYVILDNVPAQVVADATIVNRVADMTLFVIRAGNLDRRLLPDIELLNESGKFNNMCLVLNGVSHAYLYNSYYGYGYHKKYGYGY